MWIYEAFRPDQLCATVYDMDLEALAKAGYRYLLLDLDNTLVPWNDCEVTPELTAWFSDLRARGFSAVLLSNNHAARIEPVARVLGVPFLPKAGKPGKKAALRAMAVLDAQARQTVLVGDQLITDVWTGKMAGLYTVLVSPISDREYGGTKINRILERFLLKRMRLTRP